MHFASFICFALSAGWQVAVALTCIQLQSSVRGDFWASSIRVFPSPTSSMQTIFGFPSLIYYSIDLSKRMGNLHEVLKKCNRLTLKLNQFICKLLAANSPRSWLQSPGEEGKSWYGKEAV